MRESGRKPRPRQQVLPGTEAVRDKVLDALFETIGNAREDINDARKDEQQAIVKALQRMTERSIQVYTHNGVEGARVPGADKLRVRVVDSQGDVEVEEPTKPKPDGKMAATGAELPEMELDA